MSSLMMILNQEFLGNSVRAYLLALAIVAGTILIALLVNRHLRRRLDKWSASTKTLVDDFAVGQILPPLIMYLVLAGVALAANGLNFATEVELWINRVFLASGLAIFFLLLIRFSRALINVAAAAYLRRLEETKPSHYEEQMKTVERLKKQASEIMNMALGLLGVLTILSNLGINLKAIWASLGIGGIALALAVKEPLSNLVGRMYIYGTGIFDEGHFIVFDKWSGTVTRISVFRTYMQLFSDMTTVSIPNAEFVKGVVQNYYGRTQFMFKWDLDVPYDVPPGRLQDLVSRLTEMVRGKPEVNPDVCWIYLDRLDKHSKVVRVWFQACLPTWAASLTYGHQVLQDVQVVFEELGVEFAFPTQTLHLRPESSAPGPVSAEPVTEGLGKPNQSV